MPSKASFAEMGVGGGSGLNGGLGGLMVLDDDEDNVAKANAAGIKVGSRMLRGQRLSIEVS
jgi:hypothetical protein